MKEFYFLWAATALALLASVIVDPPKTLRALRVAAKRLTSILPRFVTMLILVSITLFLVSDELIATYLGSDNKYLAVFLAALLGSVTLMPGFIAFPLAGILLTKGVPYMVLSAFTTTLMTVGVLTYPIEKAYLGAKVTIMRNTLSFSIALAVALMTGIVFGEVFS